MFTVLVCDDDKEIVNAIEIYLVQEGYRVLKAYDGIQAIEMLKKEEVHLLVIDVMMPRMDGIKMSCRLKELFPNISIIFMSGYSDKE